VRGDSLRLSAGGCRTGDGRAGASLDAREDRFAASIQTLEHGFAAGENPLVVREGYKEASLWERVWYTVGGIFA
jgi:hypothetical protein